MPSKTLVVLMAVAIVGVSSTAMAKGGGGGGGKGGSSHGGMAMHGHGQFDHRFHFVRRFNRNLFLGGWGWGDWGWGGYGDSGYGGNTTVVVFPQAVPQAAKGDPAPCNWNQQEFTVSSSAGGSRPVQVVSCH
jgi:hypothetical protein